MMNVSPSAWRLPLCTGVALGALWLAGCQACDVEVTHVDRAGQVEETVAELAISGMMCEIACVSKVRKDLYDLPGVTRADIHFDADQNVDTAFVVYDPTLVEPEALIATVQDIGDDLYSVKAAQVVHYAPQVGL